MAQFLITLFALWMLFVFFRTALLLGVRAIRWLIQPLRNYFPKFDRWIENNINLPNQRFEKRANLAFRLFLDMLIFELVLVAQGCRYIFWLSLYFRDRPEAANPETDPERLRRFSGGVNPNPLLCKVIASNPNTPSDVLLKLGERFPKQLFANPVFDLLLLEDPNLLKTMPKNTLKSLLRLEAVPISFLEQAASYYLADAELMKIVSKHPKTPKDVLKKITQRN